jgi:hypothetical protein
LQHAPGGRQRAFGQHLGFDAVGLDALLQGVEVGIVFDFVRDVFHARLVGGREDQRVFVPLVPALEIDIALLVFHGFLEAQHFFIVLDGRGHVHHPQVDVADSHDAHFMSP